MAMVDRQQASFSAPRHPRAVARRTAASTAAAERQLLHSEPAAVDAAAPTEPPPREPPSTVATCGSTAHATSNEQIVRPAGIGRNLSDSLAILGFSLEDNVTERHIRRRYMEMARKYHPDKNNPEETGRNHEEATQYFQLLNNAQAYLRDRL